jgi:hypothetical protein
LPGSSGMQEPTEEEEDIYEVLPGEKFHLLIVSSYFQKPWNLQTKPVLNSILWRRECKEAYRSL